MSDWNTVNGICCKPWLVLPAVYSDALSYGDQIAQFCSALNKVIQNNNNLPGYVQQMIQEYISGGVIGEVVQTVIAKFILNVKYPPEGLNPAVGDGSADDTEAIQGCIDYASANGGVVYFPYGSYLTQPLTMKDGVSLFGFDRYSTKIVLKGGATKPLIGGSVADFSIANLTLDGNSGIQVNDVNVVTIMATNVLFTNLIIKDGYTLVNYVGTGGHFQISDVVFGNAVEKCLLTTGNADVQCENVVFNQLSAVGGVSVMDIGTDGGFFNVKSLATCNQCIVINGNNNKISAIVKNAATPVVDNGLQNNIEIFGISNKEFYSGDTTKEVSGSYSKHIGDTYTKAVDGNANESVNGYFSSIVTGVATETYKNNKTVTGTNETKNLSGKKSVSAASSFETISGEKSVSAASSNETISGEKSITANSLTENITENKTETINGNYNGKFGSASFETNSSMWKVKFPNKTVDLADIGKFPVRNFWLIGDSYGNTYHPETQTYTDGWCNLLAKNLLPSFPFVGNIYIDFQGGAGFSGGSSTFTSLITEWINKYNDITDVVICAGRNDFYHSTENINNGMLAVANVIKAKFPNVRLYVGMIGYDLNITEVSNNKFYAAIETTVNYKNGAANYGYTYLTNVESILHNTDLMRADDGKHPNEEGGNRLAEGIFQALQGCCNIGYPLRSCNVTVSNGTVQKGEFREILNNTTISILNMEGINITFSPNRNITCNPEQYTELLGTVDFKYFNGYEYGLSRIPAIFVYSNSGVYGTASGYVAFEGHNLYVAILKLNDEKNNFDTIEIDSLQIMPFSTQYTF